MMSAGAVACVGMMPAMGANTTDSRNRMPTTTEVRPVRPPSEIPVEDSTKVVTVEVPRQAPTQVAHASAISALSPWGRLPFSSSMPALLAVPMSVPTVSKQSQMLKVTMAVSTGRMPWENRPPKSNLNSVGAMEMLFSAMSVGMVVRPMGMPMIVVATMPRNSAPLTFHAIRIPVMSRPMRASSGPLVVIAPMSE